MLSYSQGNKGAILDVLTTTIMNAIGIITIGIVPWGTLFYYFSRGRKTNLLIWLVMTTYMASFVGAVFTKLM